MSLKLWFEYLSFLLFLEVLWYSKYNYLEIIKSPNLRPFSRTEEWSFDQLHYSFF